MLILLWQTVCWEAPPGIKEGGEKQQPSEAEGGVSEREGEDQEPQVKSEHLGGTWLQFTVSLALSNIETLDWLIRYNSNK